MIRHRPIRHTLIRPGTALAALAAGAVLGATPAGAAPAAAHRTSAATRSAAIRSTAARSASARSAAAIAMRETNLLGRVNAVRRAHHLSAVRLDSRLASSAKAWSGTMARAQAIWHDTARLRRLDDQTQEAALGETLAMIPTSIAGTAAVTTQAWLGSAPHRAELLAPDMHRAGVGIVAHGGQYFITLDIGS